MNLRWVLTALLLAVQLTDVSGILAGPLANHPQAFNDGNGPNGGAWSGVGTYDQFQHYMHGTVEWAVFGPGQFPFTGLNGWTPQPGQLTYAYQIINTGSNGVIDFTPWITDFGQLTNPGEAALGGENEASPISISQPIVTYSYYDYEIDEGPLLTGTSTGLMANSPYLPTLENFLTIQGGFLPETMVNPILASPQGALYVSPSLPGDYNLDNQVDAADYTVWRDNDGAPAGTLPNDVDGGTIGSPQYETWRTNFGEPNGAGTGAAANTTTSAIVPEPSAVLLAAIGCLLSAARTRRTPRCFPKQPYSSSLPLDGPT